jgi:hypothetical protein
MIEFSEGHVHEVSGPKIGDIGVKLQLPPTLSKSTSLLLPPGAKALITSLLTVIGAFIGFTIFMPHNASTSPDWP